MLYVTLALDVALAAEVTQRFAVYTMAVWRQCVRSAQLRARMMHYQTQCCVQF
jgi:hypothetical protein